MNWVARALWIFGLLWLGYWLFYTVPTADDFYKINLRYSAAYTRTSNRGKIRRVVLHSGQGDYEIDSSLLKPLTTEQVAALLRKSTEATVWLEKPEGRFVRAIKTDEFEIPMSRAVEWFEQQRMAVLYTALLSIVLGGFADFKLSWVGNKKKRPDRKRR